MANVSKVLIELHIENQAPRSLEAGPDDVRDLVVREAGFTEEIFIFERDNDELITGTLAGKRAVALVAHRCKRVEVTVHYDKDAFRRAFSPSATIHRVLQWAVSKQAANLTPDQRSKANLILPGTDQPLPGDAVLAANATFPVCTVTFELTLKDFTNG